MSEFEPNVYTTRTLELNLGPGRSRDNHVLLLLRGHAMGRSWPCEDQLTIGRETAADITIADDSVSRRHARLEVSVDGTWRILDLDSRNGVFVNGRQVDSAALAPGDRIQIGETCIFKFAKSDALERQLIEAQKLEAVGRLANGIAHDYNNVLMVISANATYLEESLQPGVAVDIDDVMESIAMIREATTRAAEVTRQLLDFARRGTERMDRVNVATAVISAIVMVECAIGPDVVITTDLDDRIDVEGGEGRLTQIILNLCLNANDAMPYGGSLTITVGQEVTLSSKAGSADAVPEGDWAVITVQDTGVGISPKIRDRIFEPFFTTKSVGKGSGLGLAMVYGIVTQHGGYVTVSSAPLAGATFTVYVPRIDYKQAETFRSTPTAPTKHGRVLLIDDDKYVRRATRRLLRSAGFEVVEANGGRAAIEIFDLDSSTFQFILLDLVMAGLSGLETYRLLRKIAPDAVVILCSGGGDNSLASQALEEGADAFVHKPFSLENLMDAYAEAHVRRFG